MNKWLRTSILAAIASVSVQALADFIWVEGEDAKCSVPANNAGWGNTQFLSGGKWMHLSIDPGKVDEVVKGDAVTIQYPLQVATAGNYHVWNRIGMEFVRTTFQWRIDGGEWKTVSPEELTTDLMELANWTEVAWLQLGQTQLTAGQHVLEVQLPKEKDKDGKAQKILYACDAICLSTEPFRPNSKFKPNETGRDEADLAAEKITFKLPEAAAGQRCSISLGGTWEIARADEQMPGEVAAPITDLPANAVWRAIPVPSDKNLSRPDYVFAHRVWYRTRVEVPANLAGRAFLLDFPLNNLNTTVVVNGQQCGFSKDPFARFQIDVTKAVKPGEVNEILVGIRDSWYGRTADPDRPLKLRKTFNIPMSFIGNGFQDLDYPVWNCPQSGILATPTFVAAGGIYASDVFVKPSVEKKQMIAEVTVSNAGTKDAAGEIRWEALDAKSGEVAKTFAAKPFSVAAGKSQTLEIADGWADAKLWWPDQPNMYRLRTAIVVDGKPVDSSEVSFGFREWKVAGTQFTLNGIVWHLWADLIGAGSTKETWLAAHRDSRVRTYRYSTAGQAPHDPHWFGLEAPQALDFMDQNGIVVRRNSTLDGETIGSNFSEADPEIRKKQGGSKIKINLMKNWIDQCVSQVKGERNHPSIQIWTIENEFAYINLINLLGNSPEMDEYEGWIKKCHDAVMAIDPTRSVMIDGGGALKDNSLGVHGDHYVNGIDGRYPDLAYEPYPEGGGRGRWKWDQKRPRFIGEDFFATGVNPADYAVFGGEVAFQGKAATRDAVATVYRMLQEGYRWGGYYAAWHFWVGNDGGERSRVANAPRAVFTREWDWSFASGAKVKRTFGIFNDTQYPDALTLTRVVTIDGKEVYKKTSEHNVKPGTAEKFAEEIAMPSVGQRSEGELVMTLSAGGKELFRDTKAISVLAPAASQQAVESQAVCVYDPKNTLGDFLAAAKLAYTPVNSLAGLPQNSRLLIVGSDAIDEKDSTSTTLAAYASAGRAVIVLDQSNPLKYQAIPAEMELAPESRKGRSGEMDMSVGRTAFIEDASHPALAGLQDKDFFTWSGDHTVYRSAYVKPTRGGKSLLQVGPRLSQTALVEVPVGKGVMYLCQLQMGQKLATSPAAGHVLMNLVNYGVNYKQEFANVSAAVSDPQLAKAIDAIGLQYSKVNDALAAISDPDKKIAIISGTPENLKALAANMPKLQEFWQRGGQVLVHSVTPAGLADFNRIVGVEHVMRPFARERVTFPAVRNPLTSGLTTGDIVMLSGKRLFGWTADEYVASDVFTNIVDYDDIAPFAKSDFASYGNMVNGFVGSDGWPLIIDFPTEGKPVTINIDLPREETVTELTYDQSVNYGATTKIAVLFDGKDRQELALDPSGDAQVFTFEPGHKARRVTLEILSWEPQPGKPNNVGIDNINLKVERSPEFRQTVRPMLNVGGMMQYVKGNGGLVLCNLNLLESEAVPVNINKKRTILAAVLRNLKAPFAGGKTVIVGADLNYQPIDIHTKATTYKDDRGWFGDKRFTFAGLPQGRHTFEGVQYDIYEMPTSPVPQVLMLGGQGVPNNLPKSIAGIPVNARADALFFLHTAKVNKRPNDKERQAKSYPAMFKYVVNYADGQTAEVPVFVEQGIESFLQKQPAALPGAQLAWVRPYEGSDEQAAAYALQWNNLRPDAEIKSVDMAYVDESQGIPVLLALTAATAR